MDGGMDGTVADHPAYRAHRAVKEKEKDGWRDGWKRRRIRRRGEGEVGWMVKEKNNESVHMVGRMDR